MDPNVFVPDVLKPFWPYIAGGVFPEQRYDDMVAKADEQDAIADKLGRLRKEAGDGVVALLQSGAWEGAAKAEFVRLFGELVRDAGGDPAEADRSPVAVLAYVEDELRPLDARGSREAASGTLVRGSGGSAAALVPAAGPGGTCSVQAEH